MCEDFQSSKELIKPKGVYRVHVNKDNESSLNVITGPHQSAVLVDGRIFLCGRNTSNCLNFLEQETPCLNEFTDINISRSVIGYAQIVEMIITGNETFFRTDKNQLFQIGGISYTDSSPLGYVREIKCFKDKNISKLYHWRHRELRRILFCISHIDSTMYQYNIESETLT